MTQTQRRRRQTLTTRGRGAREDHPAPTDASPEAEEARGGAAPAAAEPIEAIGPEVDADDGVGQPRSRADGRRLPHEAVEAADGTIGTIGTAGGGLGHARDELGQAMAQGATLPRARQRQSPRDGAAR